MNQLAEAFSKMSQETELGRMAGKAVDKYKEDSKKRFKRRVAAMSTPQQKLNQYERRIMQTREYGLDALSICSLIEFRPGAPARTSGKPCRVAWALSDGEATHVVVRYDYLQPVEGLPETHKSTLAIVPVKTLEACDCRGYIHGRPCKLKRERHEQA